MSNNSNPNDLRNLAHAQEEIPEELEALKAWWSRNGNLITICLLVLLVCILGIRQFRSWQSGRQQDAFAALDAARTPAQLEQVIAEQKQPEVLALARIRLGQAYYHEQDYQLASAAFSDFLDAAPGHELAPIASLGLAHSREALGEISEALEMYTAFADENPDSFLFPDAKLGQARCLILTGDAGNKAEAKAMMEEFLTQMPATPWALFINELIQRGDSLTVPEAPAAPGIEELLAEPAAAEEAPAPAAEAPAPAAEAPAA